MGKNQKKPKLSFKTEYESEDVDDPSEVEISKSDSEGEIENRNDNIYTEELYKKNIVNNNKEPDFKNEVKSLGAANYDHEDGPPLKKIKLSVSNNDGNQIGNVCELMQPNVELQNNGEGSECCYENIRGNFFAEEITSDDEILTFQYPKGFDVKSLLGKTIDLSKESKLKDGNDKYSCNVVENSIKTKLNCVFPSKKTGAVFLKLPIVGHLMLRQKFKTPKKSVGTFVDIDFEKMEMPILDCEFSAKRHPLLGTEWSNHFDKVKKQMKMHKKLLRRSIRHEKSLVKAEREKKEQKKKLKDELSLLKKRQMHDFNYLFDSEVKEEF